MAINALLDKYDIFYTNQAAAELGFMLAKNKAGAKLWRRDDQRALPDSFAPGDISYANLSPDISKVIAHRYMNGGLGALEYEVEDEALYQLLRYLRSQNVDCRCRGKAYPGPKIVSVAKPSGASAAWVSPNSTSDPEGAWEYEYRAIDGSQATYAYTTVPPGWGDYLELNLTSPTPISKVRFDAHYDASAVDTIKIDVFYAGSWHQVCVSSYDDHTWVEKAVSGNPTVTKARVMFLNRAGSDREAWLYEFQFYKDYPSVGAPSCRPVTFNEKQYAAFSLYLTDLNVSGLAYDSVQTFTYDISWLARWGDYLFIAQGASHKYWYMTTGEGFTESNVTNGEADGLCKVGASLWQLKLPNKVRVSTNPINGGSWGDEIKVGDPGSNVNDMWEHDGVLHCLKEEGVFSVASDGTVTELFPELRSIAHTDAGKDSTVFRNGLYFRMGNQQEWELKGGVLSEVTPELFSPGISQYAYPCVARAQDESWLYAIMKRGASDLAILAGRWEYIAGQTRWIWHEIRGFTDLTDVATAFVCSVEGRPYLYLGSTEADENVYKVYLPITNDATADSGYKFHTAGSLWTPRYMTLLFAVNKRWLELFMRSLSLSGTNYINVYYSTDEWVTNALLKKFITSPEQTEAFTAIEATMMNLRFDFVGDSETVPPILKYHSLTAMTLMPSVTRFYHTVKCAEGLRLKANHVASRSYTYAVIQAFIETLRDEVVTLGDRWGNEHTVLVRVGREVETYDEETKKPELLYDIEAVKL